MTVPRRPSREALAKFAWYQAHPVQCVEEFWLAMTPEERRAQAPGRRVEPEQQAILNAIAGHKTILRQTKTGLAVAEVQWNHPEVMGGRRVAVRSGHGIGKSITFNFGAAWFLLTRQESKVILTGPKFDQLKATTWAGLAKFHNRSKYVGMFECKADTYQYKKSPMTWFAKILTAKDQENITGLHDPHLLVWVDEGSAESVDGIGDGLMSLATQEDNHIVVIGNATRTSGLFYDCFHDNSHLWYCLHFDSEKSANVSREWIAFMQSKYHPDSDIYRVRVKGDFPRGDPRAIITFERAEAARMRAVAPSGALELGVDPAAEGDDLMTVCIRQGMHVFEVQTKPKTTPTEQIIWVIEVVRQYRRKTGFKEKVRVKVDAGGGYGAALIEALSLNTTDNVEVIPIHNNASATDPYYKYYGTQMWYDMAAIIDDVELPNEDKYLVSELAARQWVPHAMGQVKLEPKEVFKERYGSSPNRADACVLAFAGGPKKVFDRPEVTATHFRRFEVDWNNRQVLNPGFDGVTVGVCLHYVALVLTKKLTMVGLAAFYDRYANRLWIYHEYKQERPVVDVIVPMVKFFSHAGWYKDKRNPKVVGNELMFHGDKRPVADVFLREGRLYVGEAYHYDEFGAMSLGIQLFKDGKVVIHDDVKEARRDISLWTTEGGRLAEDENPYCKALLLILSEIRHEAPPPMSMTAPRDYRPAGQQAPQPIGANTGKASSWMSR